MRESGIAIATSPLSAKSATSLVSEFHDFEAHIFLLQETTMPYVEVTSPAMLRRIRAEFIEMPGLKLTVGQAMKLWGIDERSCHALIDELKRSRFLKQTRDGSIMRCD